MGRQGLYHRGAEYTICNAFADNSGKVKPDSIVYTDFYRSYDVLDVSEFNHFRLNHSNLKSQISFLKQLVKGSLS